MKHKISLYLILMGFFFSLWAKNIGTKGVATSSEVDMSLPCISVLASSTNKGTLTEIDGQFKINNVDKKATLILMN